MKLLQVIAAICVLTEMTLANPALAEEILGRQYVVLGGGPRSLSDNEILYFPCAPINESCSQTQRELSSILSEAKLWLDDIDAAVDVYRQGLVDCLGRGWSCSSFRFEIEKAQEKHLNMFSNRWETSMSKSKEVLSKFKQSSSTRTDFEGDFTFECPTQNCLVYSTGLAGRTASQWIEILPAGRKTDLSGSRTYTVNLPNAL